jgi:hypothetical protein
MSAELEAEVLGLIREHYDSLPRTQQAALGWSSVGSECSRQLWSHLTGQPKVNAANVKILAGTRGHAMHAYLEPVFEAAGWQTEVPVEFAGIPGHVDLYRPPVVADLKTGDAAKVRAMRAYGPERGWRVQVQGYARALVEKGYEVTTVRIIAIAYDSSEEVAVWQEPYDPSVTDDALERVADLSLLLTAPEPEKFVDFCSAWCSFYDETGENGCPSLAPNADTPELSDPRMVRALADFTDHKALEKEAEQAKKAAASVLESAYGQAFDMRVKTIARQDGEEVDTSQLLEFWKLVHETPPMRRKPGYSYVDVRPVAKRRKNG